MSSNDCERRIEDTEGATGDFKNLLTPDQLEYFDHPEVDEKDELSDVETCTEPDEKRIEDCGRVAREILLDFIAKVDDNSKSNSAESLDKFVVDLLSEKMSQLGLGNDDTNAWATDMGEVIEECIKWSKNEELSDEKEHVSSDQTASYDLRKWSKTKITWNEDVCSHHSREKIYLEQMQAEGSLSEAEEKKGDYGECDFCGERLSYPLHFDHVWDTESETEDGVIMDNEEPGAEDGSKRQADDSEEEATALTTVGPIKNSKGSNLSLSKVVNFGKMIEVQEIELDENCAKCSEKREKVKYATLREMAERTKKGFQRSSNTLPRKFPSIPSSITSSSGNIKAAMVRSGKTLVNVTSNIFGRTASTKNVNQHCPPDCTCVSCSGSTNEKPCLEDPLHSFHEQSIEGPGMSQLSVPVVPEKDEIHDMTNITKKEAKETRSYLNKILFWKKKGEASASAKKNIFGKESLLFR